jgi:hypothetical protein
MFFFGPDQLLFEVFDVLPTGGGHGLAITSTGGDW